MFATFEAMENVDRTIVPVVEVRKPRSQWSVAIKDGSRLLIP